MTNCQTFDANTPLGAWSTGFAQPDGVGRLASDDRSVPLLSIDTDVGSDRHGERQAAVQQGAALSAGSCPTAGHGAHRPALPHPPGRRRRGARPRRQPRDGPRRRAGRHRGDLRDAAHPPRPRRAHRRARGRASRRSARSSTRRGIPLRVLTGGEVAETAVDGLTDEELRAVALGGGRWILLEPRAGPLVDTLATPSTHLGDARLPRADRPPRAPPRRRHVRADRAADRRRRARPGDRRLLRASADGGRDARARAARARPRARQRRPLLARRPAGARLRGALDVLAGVELLAPHLDWIAHDGPGGDRRRRGPAPRPTPPRGSGASRTWPASSSTSRASRCRGRACRKFAAPAAAPMHSASSQRRPAASAAAIAPIIVSPQPSREPRSKRGGTTSSQASSPSSQSAGSPPRVTSTARAPASRSRSCGGAQQRGRVDRALDVLGELPVVELDEVRAGPRARRRGAAAERSAITGRAVGAHVGDQLAVDLVRQQRRPGTGCRSRGRRTRARRRSLPATRSSTSWRDGAGAAVCATRPRARRCGGR